MTPAAPFLVLLVALAADLALGDPRDRWHPVAWVGQAIRWAQPRLMLGSRLWLRFAGAALVIALAGGAAGLASGLTEVASRLGVLGLLLEALALKTTLSVRGLASTALEVSRRLERGDLPAARFAVGYHLVSRQTVDLDERQVASATIESVAENLTDSLVAPLVFFLAFGLAGAVAYRVINTADAMLGYRHGVLEDFGKGPARLDDLLNLVPARLAAMILALAASPAGGRTGAALRMMWRDHAGTASPNAGWTMAAMAGALGVRLQKERAYSLGAGDLPTPGDIRRGVRIFAMASALAALLALAALTFRWGASLLGTLTACARALRRSREVDRLRLAGVTHGENTREPGDPEQDQDPMAGHRPMPHETWTTRAAAGTRA